MIRISVGMEDSLVVLSRGSRGWELVTRLDGLTTQCVAVDAGQPNLVYCGTLDRGLWCSRDAGLTWEPAGPGIAHRRVMAVTVSPVERVGDRGVVYAGTEPSALFRSEDGGRSWQNRPALLALPSVPTWRFPPRPSTHHVRWIQPDPVVAGRIFVSIEQGGVMRTPNGGQTFEDRKPDGPRDAHTLATSRHVPGRIVAAAADGLGVPDRVVMASDDAGSTWSATGAGIQHAYGWSVAIDPANPENVVVSCAHTPRQAHDPTVAESTIYYRQAGQAWQEARAGLPEPSGTVIAVLTANPVEPGVFYAASNKGVFRSPDAGHSWERLAVRWPERYGMQHVQGLAVVAA